MNTNQLNINFETARQLRDAGIEQALRHADAVHGNWRDAAFEFLKTFLEGHNEKFLCEDVAALSAGIVPPPPDSRAWGGIMTRAKNAKLIRPLGCQPAKKPSGHAHPCYVWIKI